MRQSEEVRDAMLRYCDRISASDVASFDELVSQEEATLIIGNALGEWVTGRERFSHPQHLAITLQVPDRG